MTIARASRDSETTSREASGDSETTSPEKLPPTGNKIKLVFVPSSISTANASVEYQDGRHAIIICGSVFYEDLFACTYFHT